MKDIVEFITKDGSVGLYNTKLNEIYHSKEGAKKESIDKYISHALVLKNEKVDILDICYGIGYNTKTALEYFKNINSIDCVEINENLAKNSFKYKFCNEIDKIIKENLKNPDFIHFYFEDAREFIKKTDKLYDIIFLDGFKPEVQAVLWSEHFILELSKHIKENGILTTYNHSMPIINAFYKTGMTIGFTILDNHKIGLIASFTKENIKNPLDDFEIGKLNTKSAITYTDENLILEHEKIIEKRNQEKDQSSLQTMSSYLKSYDIIMKKRGVQFEK